jgi:hypothetical protein
MSPPPHVNPCSDLIRCSSHISNVDLSQSDMGHGTHLVKQEYWVKPAELCIQTTGITAYGIISVETEGVESSTSIFRVKQIKQNAIPKRRHVITGWHVLTFQRIGCSMCRELRSRCVRNEVDLHEKCPLFYSILAKIRTSLDIGPNFIKKS